MVDLYYVRLNLTAKVMNGRKRTVTFNHERLDDIVTDHLKVGVSDPVTDGGLGSSEKVVDNGHFMPEKHEAIDKMGSDKTGAPGDEDPFAIRRG